MANLSDANRKKILVTGASGLIGNKLCAVLLDRGYSINVLTRNTTKAQTPKINVFRWDIKKGTIDPKAFEDVSYIIHLAGAGVADERWTDSRKKEILESRTLSTKLLFKYIQKNNFPISCIVSASAVGYYGDAGDRIVDEEAPPANTFLAEVCKAWEKEVRHFADIGIREVRLRIGIVLAKEGGALPQLSRTIPFGIAPYFNKQPLYYPWIHIKDVCNMFVYAIENELHGAFNATAPNPQPLKNLIESIKKIVNPKAILLPVPSFAIRLTMGEMADMLLSSQRCTTKKIESHGFKFAYPQLEKALKEIFNEK